MRQALPLSHGGEEAPCSLNVLMWFGGTFVVRYLVDTRWGQLQRLAGVEEEGLPVAQGAPCLGESCIQAWSFELT